MKFRVLGPIEVDDDQGRPIALGGPKLRALLAMLLLHPGRVVPLDRIIDQLWGDEPPGAATATLQVYVSQLRRLLEPDRLPRSPARVLVTRAPGYAMVVDPTDIDTAEVERLIVDGDALMQAGALTQAKLAFVAAIALFRGQPFSDVADQEFAAATSVRYDQLRLVATERHIDALLDLGQHTVVAPMAEMLVREHPLRERFWAQLALALYRGGRQSEALRTVQRCQSLLREELGIDPGHELRRLEQDMLEHASHLDAPTLTSVAAALPIAEAPHRSVPIALADPLPLDLERPPMVGRDGDLRHVAEAVRAAAASRGRIVIIDGEAGIGKTRLAEAAVELATRLGLGTAWATVLDEMGAPPLWPWRQLVQQFGDDTEVADLREGDTDEYRFRTLNDIADAVVSAAHRRPQLVVIDDVQWADDASLHVLRLLAHRIESAPIAIVATRRRHDGTAHPLLADTLADLSRLRLTRTVELDGLSISEIDELVGLLTDHARPGLGAVLHSRTRGNPFFVSELVKLLGSEARLQSAHPLDLPDDAVPATVRDVIGRRIARLPEATQSILKLVAVLGVSSRLVVLERFTGSEPDNILQAIEPAVLIGLLKETDDGAGWQFCHALARDTVSASLGRVQQARLHATIADVLEQLHRETPSALPRSLVEELAQHNTRAAHLGRADKAFHWSVQAARWAHDQLGYERAVVHWRTAIELADLAGRNGAEDRFDLLYDLATDLRLAGDVDAARAAIDEATDLADQLADDERLGRALTAFGGTTLWNWRPYGVVDEAMVSRLERLIGRISDETRRAELLGTLGVELYYGARQPAGEEFAGEAVRIARRLDDAPLLGRALNNLVIASQTPQREQKRLEHVNEALELVGHGLPTQAEMIARLHRIQICLRFGNVTAAKTELPVCDRLALRIASPVVRAQIVIARAAIAMLDGDWATAERRSDEAAELQTGTTIWGLTYWRVVQLLNIRSAQGRTQEVVELALAAAELEGQQPLRPTAVRALAEIGEHAEARRLAERWDWQTPGPDWSWEYRLAEWAEVAIRVGTPDPALVYQAITPLSDRFVVAGSSLACLGSFHLLLGRLAAATGNTAVATDHITAAIERNRACNAPWWSDRAEQELCALA